MRAVECAVLADKVAGELGSTTYLTGLAGAENRRKKIVAWHWSECMVKACLWTGLVYDRLSAGWWEDWQED